MISVVICTFNRAESLDKTLESLKEMTVPSDLEWELIVVDNNSTDNTREVVEQFARASGLDVRYIFEPTQGLGHARNTAVVNVRGEIVAFTDDDVRVHPHWLRELADRFSEFGCAGVGGKSIPVWDEIARPGWLVTDGPYRLSSGPIADFDCGAEPKELSVAPWGLNMAFRRCAFERYGLFRTDLGVSGSDRLGGEDTEFGRRLLSRGEKIIYSPNAVVFHPVRRKRITKRYFLSFYFNLGRAEIREEGGPREVVLYFGVPRHMVRAFAANCAIWVLTFHRKKRFYYKTITYHILGQIKECRRLYRG